MRFSVLARSFQHQGIARSRVCSAFPCRSFGTRDNSNDDAITTRRVSLPNGMDFHLTIRNPKAPHPLLCLPGALGTGASDFEALLQEGLGNEFALFCLDPRGLGGSGEKPRDFSPGFYQRDASDAESVMAQLGLSEYSVLGWSDGANVAVHLATTANIQKLVIWGGNAFVSMQDVEAWESLRDISKWSPRMLAQKEAIHGPDLQALNDAATDGWTQLYYNNKGDVCASILHQVQCPTLVLHGQKDAICHQSHAEYLARQIPDANLVLLEDGKHNLHQKHAKEFHAIVRDFLLEDGIQTKDENDSSQPCIESIAYGFMGSKALSVALKLGVFDAIESIANETTNPSTNDDATKDSKGFATFDQILDHCEEPIPKERLQTLLSACVSLQLIRRRSWFGQDVYWLPRASAQQLVRTSNRYWGDYIVGQVDAQFYTRMKDLDQTIVTGDSLSYEAWFETDPEAAKKYTNAQHNGSLATGYGMLKRLPELKERFPNLNMLDVGGGSGAFSIATARKIQDATCVVLDLPNVVKVAEEIISNEDPQVQDRLSTLALSATAPDQWKGIVPDASFDVVLMSYVSGSIPADALPGLYANAFSALKPGGIAILHDFFVDNHGRGPQNAALWALTHVTVNPQGMGLRPGRIIDLLLDQGFVSPRVDDMIPETTQLIVATKP